MSETCNKGKGMSGAAFFDYLKDVVSNLETTKISEKKSESQSQAKQKSSEDFFHPENIFNKTRNFPLCPASANAAMLEAEKLVYDERAGGFAVDILEEDKHFDAAKLMVLSVANTFQHRVLLQYGKRIMKKVENINMKTEEKDADEEELFDEKHKRLMLFESFDKTSVIDKISYLPPSWTIVQISGHDPLVTRFKKTKAAQPLASNPDLTLVRMSGGRLRVARCPAPSSNHCSSYMKEFKDIITESTHISKNAQSNILHFIDKRKDINNRLKAFLTSIEDKYLGFEKCSLLGSLENDADEQLVRSVIEESVSTKLKPCQMDFLVSLFSATPFLSDEQLLSGLSRILPSLSEDERSQLTEAARHHLQSLDKAPRNPVILILDSEVQSICWESLPSLRKCHQAVSRVPSLPYLYSLWTAHASDNGSVVTSGVAQDNIFYVLNPDKSLPATEKRLGEAFKCWESWEGVVGEVPKKQQLQQALQGKDAFMYCGHGSGSKYLPRDEVEKLRVRAVPLLLGCSSGELTRVGRTVDPLGDAHSYLIAASPALLGFLWPVTDRDVDRWTVTFLEHWLRDGGQEELLQAVADKREDFMHFTNGAALVVYGLPLRARR